MAEAVTPWGNALRRQGQGDRGIADYDEAIRLNPNSAIAFDNRGYAYRMLGQQARADADFAKARQLDPNLPPPSP